MGYFIDALPQWSKSVFLHAGLSLDFEEQKMNCSSCSFARGDQRDNQHERETYFKNLKCCTFFPDLPNFACGIELACGKNFDQLLATSELSLPLGILAPDSYKQAYPQATFGQSEALLCPHFDRTALNCSVWNSRPSSCVSFVCKSSLELVGQKIWAEVEGALRTLEVNLSYYAALEAGLVNHEINSKNWILSSVEKQKFYLRTADVVASLSPSEKIEIAGDEFNRAMSNLESLAHEVVV